MKENQDNHIRIGKKPANKYIAACLFSLERYGTTIIEGLGRRSDRVLDITDKLTEISNIEAGSPQVINVDNTSGLRVKVTKEGEIK